jgi:solute:Na+ symporter, SSS family
VVRTGNFSYLQVVFGYALGYLVIAHVLLPLYYRLGLTSIYTYLERRLGLSAQRTGSAFFLVSRLLGAAARLYLAAGIVQRFVFDRVALGEWRIPFWLSVTVIIGLILVYTYRGGIKTLVWTDTFQSTFLLLGLVLSVVGIVRALDLGHGNGCQRFEPATTAVFSFGTGRRPTAFGRKWWVAPSSRSA